MEEELIARSRNGDCEAFGKIVRRYQGIVSGVTFGILGDYHKSEDIAQETFLVAWRKLDDLREIEKLPGWLCGIARNLAKQYQLRLPKMRVVSVSQTEDIAEHDNDPALLLAREEQNRMIWAALERYQSNTAFRSCCFTEAGSRSRKSRRHWRFRRMP
ncbi:MAG: sigma-70 family RNA polymerase sigma factor [Planctomycetaceae bacterium]|nr:sigma-70 family RNA polymerase sigma factor [Planctomycetaceae bacterium]